MTRGCAHVNRIHAPTVSRFDAHSFAGLSGYPPITPSIALTPYCPVAGVSEETVTVAAAAWFVALGETVTLAAPTVLPPRPSRTETVTGMVVVESKVGGVKTALVPFPATLPELTLQR